MRLLQYIVKIIKHLFVYPVSGWVHPKSQVKQVPRTTMFGLDFKGPYLFFLTHYTWFQLRIICLFLLNFECRQVPLQMCKVPWTEIISEWVFSSNGFVLLVVDVFNVSSTLREHMAKIHQWFFLFHNFFPIKNYSNSPFTLRSIFHESTDSAVILVWFSLWNNHNFAFIYPKFDVFVRCFYINKSICLVSSLCNPY